MLIEQVLKYKESDAERRRVYLILIDSTDGVSPVENKTDSQPTISYNGEAPVNTENTLVHISNGIYYVELDASEVGILGKAVVSYDDGDVIPAGAVCLITGDPYHEGYPIIDILCSS